MKLLLMMTSNEKQIQRVCQLMINYCHRCGINRNCETPVRDAIDVYLLMLSDAVHADYLISGDADLTVLGQHNRTRIMDFGSAFAVIRKPI